MAPPQHGMQGPTTANPPQHVRPRHHAIPNMVCKTATATNDHNNGNDNGVAVGTLPVGDSGMVAAGMAAMVRHSYYLRLYIFYLCNKWILFLYFVIKANNILLLLSITDVKSNNNK